MSSKRPAKKVTVSSALTKVVESSTKKGDLKKAQIIEASIVCIAKHGIEKASFEKIGKEANMTRAHVNYYFKEKPDLLKATLEYVLVNAQEMTAAHLAKVEESSEILKAMNDVTFDWLEAYPSHISVLALLNYYCIVDKKFKDFNTAARETSRQRMMKILSVYRPDLKTAELRKLAFAVHALMTGYILEYSTSDLKISVKQLRADCYSKIEKLIEIV